MSERTSHVKGRARARSPALEPPLDLAARSAPEIGDEVHVIAEDGPARAHARVLVEAARELRVDGASREPG